jgi:hypothetical protein
LAITFITVNAKTNSVVFAGGYSIPFFPNPDLFTTFADDTDTGVKDLIANVNAHLFDSVMIGKPYINAYYDGTNIIGNLINTTTIPAQVSVSLFGKVFQADVTGNQFTFPITIHPAVGHQRVTVSVMADGFPFTSLEIAGSNGNVESQIYKDVNGIYQIVPEKNVDLAAYWQNTLVDMSYSAVDLATADEIAIYTLFKHVLPALNLMLSPQEEAAIAEIQNNLLPSYTTTLSNLVDGNLHYESYKLHTGQGKQAMEKYVADRIEISKYTTLK